MADLPECTCGGRSTPTGHGGGCLRDLWVASGAARAALDEQVDRAMVEAARRDEERDAAREGRRR